MGAGDQPVHPVALQLEQVVALDLTAAQAVAEQRPVAALGQGVFQRDRHFSEEGQRDGGEDDTHDPGALPE